MISTKTSVHANRIAIELNFFARVSIKLLILLRRIPVRNILLQNLCSFNPVSRTSSIFRIVPLVYFVVPVLKMSFRDAYNGFVCKVTASVFAALVGSSLLPSKETFWITIYETSTRT